MSIDFATGQFDRSIISNWNSLFPDDLNLCKIDKPKPTNQPTNQPTKPNQHSGGGGDGSGGGDNDDDDSDNMEN